MSFSANSAENDVVQVVPTPPPTNDCESFSDIPRRLMRVKVLYTFDDQNKSNCLARLPNAMNIPTVFLNATTEVGVIELKNCIQAIASSSPELVAKLDHDYTVYAYDFSEYETPLVGQGMLSWILASASVSPNAPAEQSETMVTGRVCKNILGLFSNGIKETLEVKLKLIPVPRCLQREYVENMERYHSLSKLMPEGLDYNAWADFLKANPTIGQLAYSTSADTSRSVQQTPFGGVDPIHEMLTRPMSQGDPFQHDMYSEQLAMSFHTHGTRASSPAVSTASYNPYLANHDSRPASRSSFRSVQPARHQSISNEVQSPQDEGPSKKRVRLTQAKRPKQKVLGANNDSLRVTASTAASVRLHRPIATNPTTALASIEKVPRAPTPRPSHSAAPQAHGLRLPAPSLLRHASIDESRPYVTPYDPGVFSDTAVESADDERGNSPAETPMDMPSSPPVMRPRLSSSAPSSPGLPTLPCIADSGFVSDMAPGRDDDDPEHGNKIWEGSDLPISASDVRTRPSSNKSHHPWTEVNPGPVELLPKSYIPKPKQYPRQRSTVQVTDNTENRGEYVQHAPSNKPPTTSDNGRKEQFTASSQDQAGTLDRMMTNITNVELTFQAEGEQAPTWSTTMPLTNPNVDNLNQQHQHQRVDGWQQFNPHVGPQNPITSSISNGSIAPPSRSTTPNPPPKRIRTSNPKGLPRSHTWSGGPMSDAVAPLDGTSRQPRSGSGAKRKQNISNKLKEALDAGEMPTFCNNCGEIETPTWRKAYTRVEVGDPTHVKLSTDGSGIVGFEIMEPTEGGGPKYRIFKQLLDQEEKEAMSFKSLTLCNPCGLWLNKKGSVRPQSVWGKKAADGEKPKRKRKPAQGSRKRVKENNDELRSDAIIPHSEPVHDTHGGPIKVHMLQAMDDATAQTALQRAIQSSPVGFRGSEASPIDIDPDLTPRPTRRLLFPSPRKAGETKSLDGRQTSVSPKSMTAKTTAGEFKPRTPFIPSGEVGKENCPPMADQDDDDDLAHLFEDSAFRNKTPTKNAPLQDLLKTPTPGSRRRVPLTPKRGADIADLKTPSRNILTTPIRSGRAVTIAPETPFTRQLNALMSDCMPSSPSQVIDFSAFPSFNTPGRATSSSQFCDFMNEEFMSSDLPIPSSPHAGLDFSLYEDPATSTIGLWSGPSIFNSDPIRMDGNEEAIGDEQTGSANGIGHETMLKIDSLNVDFAAMTEEVVANVSRDVDAHVEIKGKVSPEMDLAAHAKTNEETNEEKDRDTNSSISEDAMKSAGSKVQEQKIEVLESQDVKPTDVR